MKVKETLSEKIKNGTLHMTLIDPDKQVAEKGGEIAKVATDLGTDAIMVGGSTGVTQKKLDDSVIAIRSRTKVPIIYFPSGARAMSSYCDAILFMSMLNSRNLDMVIGEQVKGAMAVKKLGIEPISMGYIIVAPGMKVGEVGQADCIPRDDLKLASSYALAAEFLGMQWIYLEAGSGAPEPVPANMIKSVKATVNIPVIVGGGIKDAECAMRARKAGANMIVTGTVVENGDYEDQLASIIRAIKENV